MRKSQSISIVSDWSLWGWMKFFIDLYIWMKLFWPSCSVCDICLLTWEAHWGCFVEMQHISSFPLNIMSSEVHLRLQRTNFQFQHPNSLRRPSHPGNHIHSHFLHGCALTQCPFSFRLLVVSRNPAKESR